VGPHPAVAAVRRAVEAGIGDLSQGSLVLAACSGGPDSLALAAALAFTAPRLSLRGGAVTIDHGLQPGSQDRAAGVAKTLSGIGLDPVEQAAVEVGKAGGPEAAARTARYGALGETAARLGAAAILLGHTLDDQAETVLLGLARGSGARSLAGMPPRSGLYRRPLLGVRRAVTAAACAALGLETWDDPHNRDPAFARARVRHEVLPVLERALGPGVAAALARTARQLRADGEALSAWADQEAERLRGGDGGLEAGALTALPAAVRSRVLHGAAVAAGCPAGSLTAHHVSQLEMLLTGWRGQRWIDLPAGIRAVRRYGRLHFMRAGETPAGEAAAGEAAAGGGEAVG
jgi:tRNA(Ile)-lysidine synthase